MSASSSMASIYPQVEICRGYFERHLPPLFGQLLIEDLHSVSAEFAIHITDSPDPAWVLCIENGRLTSVAHDGGAPICTFSLGTSTLLDIVAAQLRPDEAFFNLQIQLTGDMETGLMLSIVLASFFERYPYAPQ